MQGIARKNVEKPPFSHGKKKESVSDFFYGNSIVVLAGIRLPYLCKGKTQVPSSTKYPQKTGMTTQSN